MAEIGTILGSIKMEFECPQCKKIFRPHPFIGLKHPSQAKCPVCKVRGKITKQGKKIRNSRFHAINQANVNSTNINSPKFISRQKTKQL